MSLFRYCVCLWLLFVFLFIVYCHFCTATLTLVHLYLLRTPPPPPTVNIRLDQPSKPERLIYIFYMMNVCFSRISLSYISLLFLAIPNLIPAPPTSSIFFLIRIFTFYLVVYYINPICYV